MKETYDMPVTKCAVSLFNTNILLTYSHLKLSIFDLFIFCLYVFFAVLLLMLSLFLSFSVIIKWENVKRREKKMNRTQLYEFTGQNASWFFELHSFELLFIFVFSSSKVYSTNTLHLIFMFFNYSLVSLLIFEINFWKEGQSCSFPNLFKNFCPSGSKIDCECASFEHEHEHS